MYFKKFVCDNVDGQAMGSNGPIMSDNLQGADQTTLHHDQSGISPSQQVSLITSFFHSVFKKFFRFVQSYI